MLGAIRHKLPVSDSTLIRSAILTGLVVGLLGLGFLAPRVRSELVLIAIAAPPVVLLALSRLEYGVLAIILTAAFVRFSIGTGTGSRIVASLVMTAVFIVLWLTRMFVVDRNLRLKPSRVNAPLLGFIATAFVSYLWSNAFRDSLVVVWDSWPFVQIGALAVIILLPGAFLLTANAISEVRWLKALCWSMILIGVLSLASHYLHIEFPFLNTRGLFSLWFIALAYGQALYNTKLPLWLRVSLLGLVGAGMFIYLIRQVTWLSGWVPPLVAIVTITFLKSKRLFLVLVILAAAYLMLNWGYYTGTVLNAESAESGHTRLAAWEHNWRVTGKHLLFGTGPAGYAAYYMSYFPGEAMATHSNYIDVLSQVGILGLLLCLWFFGALGWTGYKLCLRLKGTGDFSEGLAAAALAGCVGCVVAMGLGDWLFPFVYTQTIAGFDYAVYSWVLLGGIVVLDDMCRREGRP